MWKYEHTIETDARPTEIWRLYSDVSTWSTWDQGIERVELDGPFQVGSTGRMKPAGQETLPFRLVQVEENRVFADETEVAGVVLRFTHSIDALDDGRTRLTHRVSITGPAAEQVAPGLGPAVTAGIPTTMATLVGMAK
jgi:polyketide cyclase/dehydrase/lipid transport protein